MRSQRYSRRSQRIIPHRLIDTRSPGLVVDRSGSIYIYSRFFDLSQILYSTRTTLPLPICDTGSELLGDLRVNGGGGLDVTQCRRVCKAAGLLERAICGHEAMEAAPIPTADTGPLSGSWEAVYSTITVLCRCNHGLQIVDWQGTIGHTHTRAAA